jgi:hypothetical protein
LIIELDQRLFHQSDEGLRLFHVLNVVKDSPLVDCRLLKHFVPRQIYLQVLASLIYRKLDPLANLVHARVDASFGCLQRLVAHQNIASIVLRALDRCALTLNEESPVLHPLNAVGI